MSGVCPNPAAHSEIHTSWQPNPTLPPFVPRPTYRRRRLTAAHKKSLRRLKLFPFNLRFRKLNNAQSATIRIQRRTMSRIVKLNQRLDEQRHNVLEMTKFTESIEATQRLLFSLAARVHSITVAPEPPPAPTTPVSGPKRKRSPPPTSTLPSTEHLHSSHASPPLSVRTFMGLKKGWFDKL